MNADSNVVTFGRIDDLENLLDFALGSSASQVKAYCRKLRHGNVDESARDAQRFPDPSSRRWRTSEARAAVVL